MPKRIDLNANIGESYGRRTLGNDSALIHLTAQLEAGPLSWPSIWAAELEGFGLQPRGLFDLGVRAPHADASGAGRDR